MEDEAPRTRQRVLRHARRETRGELRERGAARPEGEVSGRTGGARASSEKASATLAIKIHALGREWRAPGALRRRIEPLQERALVRRSRPALAAL